MFSFYPPSSFFLCSNRRILILILLHSFFFFFISFYFWVLGGNRIAELARPTDGRARPQSLLDSCFYLSFCLFLCLFLLVFFLSFSYSFYLLFWRGIGSWNWPELTSWGEEFFTPMLKGVHASVRASACRSVSQSKSNFFVCFFLRLLFSHQVQTNDVPSSSFSFFSIFVFLVRRRQSLKARAGTSLKCSCLCSFLFLSWVQTYATR